MDIRENIKTAVIKKATLIGKIDEAANRTFDAFRDTSRKWSLGNLKTIREMHRAYRAKLATARVETMNDMHLAQKNDIATHTLGETLEQIATVSAKLDTLIVTATSSMREDLSNKDVMVMDENGVMQKDRMKKAPGDHMAETEEASAEETASTEEASTEEASTEEAGKKEAKMEPGQAQFEPQDYDQRQKMKDIENSPDPLFDKDMFWDDEPTDPDMDYSKFPSVEDDFMTAAETAESMVNNRDVDAMPPHRETANTEEASTEEASTEDIAGSDKEASTETEAEFNPDKMPPHRETANTEEASTETEASTNITTDDGANVKQQPGDTATKEAKTDKQVAIAEFIESTTSSSGKAMDDTSKEASKKEVTEARKRTASKESTQQEDIQGLMDDIFTKSVMGDFGALSGN